MPLSKDPDFPLAPDLPEEAGDPRGPKMDLIIGRDDLKAEPELDVEALINLDPDIEFHLASPHDDRKGNQVRWARQAMTKFEKKVWKTLGDKQNPWLFFPQVEICGFIVDFYTPLFRVVLEADGPDHDRQIHQDRVRDLAILKRKNIRTLRLTPLDLGSYTAQDLYRLVDTFVRLETDAQDLLLDQDDGGLR